MNIPEIPSLPAGHVVTAADLNGIASACTFLLAPPRARVHDVTGNQTLGTSQSAATAVSFPVKDYDSDGIWTPGAPTLLTIQTGGYYRARYSVQITSATGYIGNTFVVATAGPNNPLGNGTVIAKALYGYADAALVSSVPAFAGASGPFPAYLYAGDTLAVKAWSHNSGDKTSATTGFPSSSFSILFASA